MGKGSYIFGIRHQSRQVTDRVSARVLCHVVTTWIYYVVEKKYLYG